MGYVIHMRLSAGTEADFEFRPKSAWRNSASSAFSGRDGMPSASPDPISRDRLLTGAKERLIPFSYSLDIAWQQRIQSFTDTVINDPTRGRVDVDRNLVEALRNLERTGISDRLQEWLIEADPFKQNHDEGAIAARGEKLAFLQAAAHGPRDLRDAARRGGHRRSRLEDPRLRVPLRFADRPDRRAFQVSGRR